MGLVAILCAKTGKQISTGIEADSAAFLTMGMTMPRMVDCWACGGRHSWSRRWATIVECNDPASQKAGTPISMSQVLTGVLSERAVATT